MVWPILPPPEAFGDSQRPMSESQRADLSQRRGRVAATLKSQSARRSYVARQGSNEAHERTPGDPWYWDSRDINSDTRLDEASAARSAAAKAKQSNIVAPSKKTGGRILATGLYKLHKGETVKPKSHVRSRAARAQLSGKKGKPWRKPAGKAKVTKVMHEFGSGKLHSGSKKGPLVTSRKQAIAIGLSQARKAT